MDSECTSPSSIKDKLKSSICCFRTAPHTESLPSSSPSSSSPRSAYTWLKSTAQELEIRDKCRSLISRIGNKSRNRHSSADFRYDPLSYALNFEDEQSRFDECPISFSSRLPTSPERLPAVKCGKAPVVAMSRQIVAYS